MTHMWRPGMKFLEKLILSSIFIVVLAGCAASPPKLLPKEKRVEVNPAVMADCGNLIDTLPLGSSFEDTLIAHAEDSKTFAQCKELNKSKKQIIERFLINEGQKSPSTKPETEVRRIGIFG